MPKILTWIARASNVMQSYVYVRHGYFSTDQLRDNISGPGDVFLTDLGLITLGAMPEPWHHRGVRGERSLAVGVLIVRSDRRSDRENLQLKDWVYGLCIYPKWKYCSEGREY